MPEGSDAYSDSDSGIPQDKYGDDRYHIDMRDKRKHDNDQDKSNKKQDRHVQPKRGIPVVEISSKCVCFRTPPKSPTSPTSEATPPFGKPVTPPKSPVPIKTPTNNRTAKGTSIPTRKMTPKTYLHPSEVPKTNDEDETTGVLKPIRHIEKKYHTMPFDSTKFLHKTEVQALSIVNFSLLVSFDSAKSC